MYFCELLARHCYTHTHGHGIRQAITVLLPVGKSSGVATVLQILYN